MGFLLYLSLPNLGFFICLGWMTGVIFTRNPLRFSEFKTWQTAHTVFAVVLNLCSTIFAVDHVLDMMAVDTTKVVHGNVNQVSLKVAQGVLMVYVTDLYLLRVYLTWKAKQVSVFLSSIQNIHEGHSGRRRRTGFLLLLIFILVSLESVSVGMGTHATNLRKEYTWRAWLHGYPYSITIFLFTWCAKIVHVVVFALISCTLNRMLAMFDRLAMRPRRKHDTLLANFADLMQAFSRGSEYRD